MMQKTRQLTQQWALPMIVGVCLLLFVWSRPVGAINGIPTPSPKPGSYGLEAMKPKPPPTVGATITTPGNGATFAESPITVTGICPNDLLVQVLNNGVLVGAVMCENGSFTMKVSLFAGTNELTARVYDELDQTGPESNVMTVTYNDTRFTAFGAGVTLTSSYGRRSAAAGSALDWPLQLSGGTGPYAFSTDWGDGAPAELKSQPLAGVVTIAHPYKKAGIYRVNVRVTDVNGVSAFLQLVAVSNGEVNSEEQVEAASTEAEKPAKILWIPAAASAALLIPAFWLGRRSQTISLRNKMMKERDAYQKTK